jgi:putative ABC transport system permease protein
VIALCVIGVFVTATNLHASLISRMPELVTFVALGVRRGSVAQMILLESVMLAGLGAIVALGLALVFQGRSSAMFSSAAKFELQLGLVPILFALGLAVVVGLFGGLVPALMVRRIDVVRGLR